MPSNKRASMGPVEIFEIGQMVFAKMRGYVPWPARVEEVVNPNTRLYKVFFFGTYQFGNCKGEDLKDYNSNKETLGKPKKLTKSFKNALQEIEETPDLKVDENVEEEEEDEEEDNEEEVPDRRRSLAPKSNVKPKKQARLSLPIKMQFKTKHGDLSTLKKKQDSLESEELSSEEEESAEDFGQADDAEPEVAALFDGGEEEDDSDEDEGMEDTEEEDKRRQHKFARERLNRRRLELGLCRVRTKADLLQLVDLPRPIRTVNPDELAQSVSMTWNKEEMQAVLKLAEMMPDRLPASLIDKINITLRRLNENTD